MDEYKLKIKILLFGFPPLKEEYEADGFILKSDIINQKEVSDNIEKKDFTTLPYIIFCTYNLDGDSNRYFNYFESKSDIIIKIPKNIKEKSKVEEYILKKKQYY